MARIPEYTQQVFLDRSQPGNVDAIGQIGFNKAAQTLQSARQIMDTGNSFQELGSVIAQQRKVDGQLRAQSLVNDIEQQSILHEQEQKNARMQSPDGFSKDMDQWWADKSAEQEQLLSESTDPFDKKYFQRAMSERRTQALRSNSEWENSMRVQNIHVNIEKNVDQMNNNFSLSKPDFKDFSTQLSKVRDYVNTTGAQALSPENQYKLTEYAVDGAAQSFINQKMQDDPVSLKRVVDYGARGKDGVIAFEMYDIEGGDKVVSDGNGVSKYGINSDANKGVDVKNLTSDQAAEIYKSKYWDKRLDKFDQNFQVVAFDALINHGNDKDTWAMIDKANGNPYALIELRRQEYARLVQENPEKYAKYQAGWENRLNKVGEFARTMDGGGRDFLNNASLIDPKIINHTIENVDTAIERKKMLDIKAQKEAMQVDEITQLQNQQKILDNIESPDLSIDEKMLSINNQELHGQINQEFAQDARRYLQSVKSISAITNANKMSEIVTRMYDLNGIADTSEKDYLIGILNVKKDIQRLRANGELSRDDELKLSNQLKTLTSSKISDATNSIAYSFGKAKSIIDNGLPPEMRGEAIRSLFYEAQSDPTVEGMSKEKRNEFYKQKAQNIVDDINNKRRSDTLNVVKDVVYPVPSSSTDLDFIKSKGYTMSDVEETARKYNITQKQVIERLRNVK